jgi:hypothetical protein
MLGRSSLWIAPKEVRMTRIKSVFGVLAAILLLLITFGSGWIVATLGIGSALDPAALPERERQFAERMNNVALVGSFTGAGGEERAPRADRYDISSVEKVGEDRWRFNARMRHDDFDVTLPVTVTMRWIDDTPMIMMTDTVIPALGTFTVRVFFYGDRYAGTWQHDQFGGHLFGRIERR